MGKKLEKITEEALQLDLRARATLARRLLESLEDLSEEENERLWTEVALARYREIREGRVQTIPSSEVLRKARVRRS